jgi:large subunit ribosomal protein L4e
MSRPLVSVYDPEQVHTEVKTKDVTLPAVFTVPIRNDVVQQVHTLMAKNARQAYGVSLKAGMQTPAQSWGTGRAVARIPRVPGGGTQRAGQGAFGNMCRGGRMFAPTKVFRKWHKKISKNMRRYAVSSALAATAVPALVMARGHRIDNVPEFPLVLSESLNQVSKTKDAKSILEKCGAMQDVDKVKDTKKTRCGAGKTRNRRFVSRKGPLVIYDVSEGLTQGFRNLPGVDLANVDNLSLLDLAPGGHLGRFCIWTQAAFEKLDSLFGTYDEVAQKKSGFSLPRSSMSNADLARIINSDEIQSVINPSKAGCDNVIPKKTNPLRNKAARLALNPHHAAVVKRAEAAKSKSAADRKKATDAVRKERAGFATRKKETFNTMIAEGDVNVW